jgi:ribonuclease-3 family protein
MTPQQARQLSASSWAYLGDAVYELHVRRFYLMPPKRSRLYHRQVVGQVRAESQARHLDALESHLTPAELEIVRLGRNATLRHPKRVDAETYQKATSLEALLGYLYLTDYSRLEELLGYLDLETD